MLNIKKIAGVDEVGRGCLAGPVFAAAVIYGGFEDAHRSFINWERFATYWDPPIPATMKPLTLICLFLIALQSVNNLIIDWKNPKEKQYQPAKDLK